MSTLSVRVVVVVFTCDVNIDTGFQLADALSIITEALQSIKEHLVEVGLPHARFP